MPADDRVQVTPYEEELFRTYVRSLSTLQLICLISVSKNEMGVREGNLPQDKRGILKASARERLSKESIFSLDLPDVQTTVDSLVAKDEETVDEQDPLGMGFA